MNLAPSCDRSLKQWLMGPPGLVEGCLLENRFCILFPCKKDRRGYSEDKVCNLICLPKYHNQGALISVLCQLPEAPAKILPEKRKALAEEQGDAFAQSVIRSSGMNPKNATRQFRRLVSRHSMSLKIPMSTHTHVEGAATASIPFVKPADVFKTLMLQEPWLFLGGCNESEAPDVLSQFWNAYRLEHPSHHIFTCSAERRKHCFPVLCHGDGGRTQKKQPLEVLSCGVGFQTGS